jgi:hypothetical protein
MDVITAFLYVGRGPAMGTTHTQGALPKCLNGFIVSDVDSETEKAIEPNP